MNHEAIEEMRTKLACPKCKNGKTLIWSTMNQALECCTCKNIFPIVDGAVVFHETEKYLTNMDFQTSNTLSKSNEK